MSSFIDPQMLLDLDKEPKSNSLGSYAHFSETLQSLLNGDGNNQPNNDPNNLHSSTSFGNNHYDQSVNRATFNTYSQSQPISHHFPISQRSYNNNNGYSGSPVDGFGSSTATSFGGTDSFFESTQSPSSFVEEVPIRAARKPSATSLLGGGSNARRQSPMGTERSRFGKAPTARNRSASRRPSSGGFPNQSMSPPGSANGSRAMVMPSSVPLNQSPMTISHYQQSNHWNSSPQTSLTPYSEMLEDPLESFVGVAPNTDFGMIPNSAPPLGMVMPPKVSRSKSVSSNYGGIPASVDSAHDLDGDPLLDKKKRRRESHNAVERRRRDNINERIAELAQLLPSAMLDPNNLAENSEEPQSPNSTIFSPSFHSNSAPSKPMSSQALAASQKPNKGVILAKSVDYMKHLKSIVELQHQRIKELENGHINSQSMSHGAYRTDLSGSFDPSASPSPNSGSPVGNDPSMHPLGSFGLQQLDVKPYIVDTMVEDD